jgi:hypothetical protein
MQEVLEHNYNTLTDYMKFYPYREILKDANI